MASRTPKMLIAGLAVGMLAVVAVACGSMETDEPASPAEPTEKPAASSESQGQGDPWDEDQDPFEVTSIVENGRRYEIKTVLSKDAIPAIFSPNFFTPEEAVNQYRDTDPVIGVSIGGEHRAYNVAYLSGHEIVNDVVGGKPIAVTW